MHIARGPKTAIKLGEMYIYTSWNSQPEKSLFVRAIQVFTSRKNKVVHDSRYLGVYAIRVRHLICKKLSICIFLVIICKPLHVVNFDSKIKFYATVIAMSC